MQDSKLPATQPTKVSGKRLTSEPQSVSDPSASSASFDSVVSASISGHHSLSDMTETGDLAEADQSHEVGAHMYGSSGRKLRAREDSDNKMTDWPPDERVFTEYEAVSVTQAQPDSVYTGGKVADQEQEQAGTRGPHQSGESLYASRSKMTEQAYTELGEEAEEDDSDTLNNTRISCNIVWCASLFLMISAIRQGMTSNWHYRPSFVHLMQLHQLFMFILLVMIILRRLGLWMWPWPPEGMTEWPPDERVFTEYETQKKKRGRPRRQRHSCEECGKTFVSQTKLERHIEAHKKKKTEDFWYICPHKKCSFTRKKKVINVALSFNIKLTQIQPFIVKDLPYCIMHTA